MKKVSTWRLVLYIAGVIAGGTIGTDKVVNYLDEDIMMVDPVTCDTIVYKSKEIKEHTYKEYGERPLEGVKSLTIHHTATDSLATPDYIASIHVGHNNWAGIGYHALIARDGTIIPTQNFETLSYHNRGENTSSIGISVIGNYEEYELNEKQIESIKALVKALDYVFEFEEIRAHKDVIGAATKCNGKYAYEQLKEEEIFKSNR